jgi:hypothetical protein
MVQLMMTGLSGVGSEDQKVSVILKLFLAY